MVTVVAAILAGDRVNGAVVGVIAGLGVLGYQRWSYIARFNAEHAELASRWRALPRSERRNLKRAVRGRGSIPLEHTALLGEQITAVEELWQRQNMKQGRALLSSVGGLAVTCLLGILAVLTAGHDRVGTVFGFAGVAFGVTVGAGLAAALVQNSFWARRWPARMQELRGELEVLRRLED